MQTLEESNERKHEGGIRKQKEVDYRKEAERSRKNEAGGRTTDRKRKGRREQKEETRRRMCSVQGIARSL